MLYDQQELYYGLDFNYCANERIGYLNPIDICEERHTFRIRDDNIELLGLEGEERVKKIAKFKMEFEAKYAFYIRMALLKYQNRESVVVPYNFG